MVYVRTDMAFIVILHGCRRKPTIPVPGPSVHNQTYFNSKDFPSNMPAIWDDHFGLARYVGPLRIHTSLVMTLITEWTSLIFRVVLFYVHILVA
jgi:hypothetical protein